MKRLILIVLLVLSGGPAYAEWVMVTSSYHQEGYSVYIDPVTIRRQGDLVKMWDLTDFEKMQTAARYAYLSSKVQREFDCAGERVRTLAGAEFSDRMGRGNAVTSDSILGEWEPVVPNSVGQVLWNHACERSELKRLS